MSLELGDDRLPGRPGHFNEYRVYADSPNVLRARLCVFLYSSDTAIVHRDVVEQVGHFTLLRSTEEVPIRTTWVPISYDPETGRRTISDRTPVVLEPSHASCWLLEFERADDAPFERGQYDVSFQFAGLQAAFRRTDGGAWRAWSPELPGTLRVLLEAPSTTREQVRVHELAAFDAMQRHDYAAQVEGYEKALALEPDNRGTMFHLAGALSMTQRYREAVALYERIPLSFTRGDLVARALAVAYLGAGRETDARALLEKSGYSASEVAEELARVSRVIGERQRR